MAKIYSRIYLLPKLWAALFESPTTGGYPSEPLQLPSGFRGESDDEYGFMYGVWALCAGLPGLCISNYPFWEKKFSYSP